MSDKKLHKFLKEAAFLTAADFTAAAHRNGCDLGLQVVGCAKNILDRCGKRSVDDMVHFAEGVLKEQPVDQEAASFAAHLLALKVKHPTVRSLNMCLSLVSVLDNRRQAVELAAYVAHALGEHKELNLGELSGRTVEAWEKAVGGYAMPDKRVEAGLASMACPVLGASALALVLKDGMHLDPKDATHTYLIVAKKAADPVVCQLAQAQWAYSFARLPVDALFTRHEVASTAMLVFNDKDSFLYKEAQKGVAGAKKEMADSVARSKAAKGHYPLHPAFEIH